VVCIGRPLSGSAVRQPAGAQVQAKAKKILRGFSGTEGSRKFRRSGAIGQAARVAAIFPASLPVSPHAAANPDEIRRF
jgi:hypothetical protein